MCLSVHGKRPVLCTLSALCLGVDFLLGQDFRQLELDLAYRDGLILLHFVVVPGSCDV